MLVLIALGEPAAAQLARITRANDFYTTALAAQRRRDWRTYRADLVRAAALWPESVGLQVRLVGADNRVGDRAAALARLSRLAAQRLRVDLSNPEFTGLAALPAFAALRRRFAEVERPLGTARTAFVIPETDLIPEGIAHDPESGDFFVSSVRHRKIVRISADGKIRDFVAEGQDGLWAVLALRVDPIRRVLWATSSALREMADFEADQDGQTGLFKFDLATGKLLGSYLLIDPAEKHTFNDLTLDAAGNVYLSDPRARALYRLPVDRDRLEVLLPPGELVAPQGLALSADGRILYVADYAAGLFALDLTSRRLTRVGAPAEVPLAGIDGLVAVGGDLVAVQNGIEPHRVVRLRLGDRDRIVGAEILAMNHPAFDEPTLGTVVDDAFYFVANSQWGRINPDGSLPGNLKPLTVLKIVLGKGTR